MKKHLLLLFMTALVIHSQAQIIYSENFSGGQLPLGYVLFNLDGLTPDDPDLSNMADSAWTIKSITAQGFQGGLCAFSVSWYEGDEGPSDDWMVLPAIGLGADPYLSWTALAITSSGDFRDQYQVFVSSEGNTIEDYILLSSIFDTGSEGEFAEPTNREISLSEFAGETVFVAFRNWTQPYNPDLPSGPGNGGNELALDNITVSDGPVSVNNFDDISTNVDVFPNPTSDILNITSASPIGNFKLFNATGQLVLSKYTNQSNYSIDVKEFPIGAYNLVIETNGTTISRQVIPILLIK